MKKNILFIIFLFFCFSVFSQIGGPWDHKVCRATSIDGLNWTRDTSFVIYPASVPGAVMDTNQTVFLYYVKMNSAADTEKLMVSASSDGEYFMTPQIANIFGSTVIRRVDPNPVKLPDGSIRLYYIDFDMMPPQKVHSAVSNDGVNFIEEPGIRFSDSTGITDPDIFFTGSIWNMYVSKGTQLIRSTSTDGLTFKKDTSFHWNSGAVSSSMMISCGLCRTYFCGNGIQSATSPDGSDLYVESGICLPSQANEFVCDPTVIHLYTGEYVMYFKSFTVTSLSEYDGCSCAGWLQNYPNPFSDKTLISLPSIVMNQGGVYILSVFDYSGKIVRKDLVNGISYISFNRNDLSSGLYFYIMQSDASILGKGKFIIE